MAALLIARFDGDVNELMQAYDRGHALIMSRGGATSFGELRHHCAVGDGALYIVGVWDSEEHARSRWSSAELEKVLAEGGFPPPKTANLTILELHAPEPPLRPRSVGGPNFRNPNQLAIVARPISLASRTHRRPHRRQES